MPTVEYNLDGDSGDFVQEFQRATGIMFEAESQADDTTRAVGKLTEAQKRAADAAKASRKEFADNVATVKHLGEMFKFGAESAAKIVSGFVNIVRSAVDAREELKAFLDADAQGNLDRLAGDLEAADNAASVLGATFASELAPEIEELINVVIGAATEIGSFIKTLKDIKDSDAAQGLMEIADIFAMLATLGANQLIWSGIETLGDKGEEAAESLHKVVGLQEEIALGDIEVGRRAEIEAKKQAKLDEEARKRAEEALKTRKEHADAIAALDGTIFDALEKEQKEAAEAEAEYQEFRYNSWKETLTAQLADVEAYTEAVLSEMEKETKAFEDQQEKKREGTLQTVEDIGTNWLGLGETLAGIWQENAEEHADKLDEQSKNIREQLKHAEEGEKAGLIVKLAISKKLADQQRKDAKTAFALSQTAAVASVLLSGAMAFAALTANLAYLTWGAPIAAAGISVPMVASQLAVIANAKGPAHDGTSFGADEFFVGDQMVRAGEKGTIHNQRAVDAGALEVSKEMNRTGRAPGMGAQTFVLADAGRVFAEAAIRDSRRPGSPFAVGSDGSSNPFRRGR